MGSNVPAPAKDEFYVVDLLGSRAEALDGTEAVVISDEVWEHVIFDGRRHVSVLAVPGLRERSVKIGSAGKIFKIC